MSRSEQKIPFSLMVGWDDPSPKTSGGRVSDPAGDIYCNLKEEALEKNLLSF